MATVYEIVTEKILEKLAAGVVPWRKPWTGGEAGMPRNLASGKSYRGINVLLLGTQSYRSPYWVTFRQATELGAKVRKGEHATPVVFWKVYDHRPGASSTSEPGDDSGTDHRFVLRYYSVFNVAQCDGITAPPVAGAPEPIPACEGIVASMPNRPVISHDRDGAFYVPALDRVNIPPRETFESAAAYYATLFHELSHSTSHESRLARHLEPGYQFARFGSDDYSREELVAEFGSAFLCGAAGIEAATLDNAASYIDHWRQTLQADPRAVVIAAAQAQRAADYILGRSGSQNG